MNKKILLVVTQSHWGGAQRYVYDLALGLKKSGFLVTIAVGASSLVKENNVDNEVFFSKIKQLHLPIHQLRFLTRSIRPCKDFLAVCELYKFIKKEKFDIVHLNSSKAGLIGSLSAKLAGCPKIIFTAHGFVFNEPMNKIKKIFYICLEKFASLFRDKIIVVSEFDKATALQYKIISKDKIVVIHNGIDIQENIGLTKEIAREKLLALAGLSSENKQKKIIGCVANFYKTKGLDVFIKAVGKIVQKNSNVLFFIIGDGELRTNLEKQISDLHLEKFVYLTGYLKDAEVYLPAFDILVSSSFKEGLSYSLLSAGSLGLPIIASKVGGNPEIIQDNGSGLLFEAGDDTALAKAMIFLLSHPEVREKFSRQIANRVQNNFSVKNMLKKTLAVYEL